MNNPELKLNDLKFGFHLMKGVKSKNRKENVIHAEGLKSNSLAALAKLISLGYVTQESSCSSDEISTEKEMSFAMNVCPYEFNGYVTLSTYQLFSEAIDFDGDFLILSTPKKDVQQCIGRILRGKNEGVRPLVIDMLDDEPIFNAMAKTRKRFYERRGFQILHSRKH
jgi:hypothetical protein